MLSKNQMVAVRTAIEKTYIGKCEVVEQIEVENSDHTTGMEEKAVLTDVPCRLSFESNAPVSQSDGAGAVIQTTKVFTSPDVDIKPGSKLTVTQNGVTTAYQCSGEPNHYASHQEVTVILFRGWA